MALRDHLYDALEADNAQDLVTPAAPRPLRGYAHVPDLVLFHQDPALTPTARMLYAVLLAHKNRGDGQCNPGEETLAALLPCSERTVRAGVALLKRLGWIAVERARYVPAKDKRATTNQYTFLLDNTSRFTALHVHVLYDETLSPEAKYAYALFAHRQGQDDRMCHASLAEIAQKAGVALRTLERWVAELHEAGYLDKTQRRFARPAKRHVTFRRPARQQPRGQSRGRDKDGQNGSQDGAEPLVNHPDANTNPPLVASANPPLVACPIPPPVAGKPDVLNQIAGSQTPLPCPVPAGPSPPALNQKTSPAARADPAKPGLDVLRTSARSGESESSHSRETGVLQGGLPPSDYVQGTFIANYVHGPQVVSPVPPLPSGPRAPRAPTAGPRRDKTQVATEPDKVRLTLLDARDLDPAWPLARRARF